MSKKYYIINHNVPLDDQPYDTLGELEEDLREHIKDDCFADDEELTMQDSYKILACDTEFKIKTRVVKAENPDMGNVLEYAGLERKPIRQGD